MLFGRVNDFNVLLILPNFLIVANISCGTANFQSSYSAVKNRGQIFAFIDYVII